MNNPVNSMPAAAEMKRAVYSKDSTYDGIFYVAVKSTKYILPSVLSRKKPLEKNISFYPSAKESVVCWVQTVQKMQAADIKRKPSRLGKINYLRLPITAEPNAWHDYDIRNAGIEPSRARRYF